MNSVSEKKQNSNIAGQGSSAIIINSIIMSPGNIVPTAVLNNGLLRPLLEGKFTFTYIYHRCMIYMFFTGLKGLMLMN